MPVENDDLRERLRDAVELVRPHPHRGDLIAAGAVPLALGVVLVNVRLDTAWGTGVMFAFSTLACAFVLGMGVLAPLEGERPRSYQVMLQLSGLALLFVTCFRLAQVLGSERPLAAAGASFWIFGATAAAAAWLLRTRATAVCALVAAIGGTLSLLAFVAWAFKPVGASASRWVLLLVACGLALGALVWRETRRRESVYLVDAAGVAMLLLAFTYLRSVFVLSFAGVPGAAVSGAGAGWKLVLVAAGLGLIAYAGVDREPGPGYLGVAVLLGFVLIDGIAGPDGATLFFWPLLLVVVGGAMVGAGLRPRRELPPEPAPRGGGTAETVAFDPQPADSHPPREPEAPGPGSLWARPAPPSDDARD